MQSNPTAASPFASYFRSGGVPETRLDLSAHGLSSRAWVPAENAHEILGILKEHFDGVDFKNLQAPVTPVQFNALLNLSNLGALDGPTLQNISDQSAAALRHAQPASVHGAEVGSEVSSASGDAPRSDGSREDDVEGGLPRDAGVQAPAGQSDRGNGVFGALSAAGRAIGNALPRATPVVMDVVCLGLSVPVAALAIKQALEESKKPVHDSTLLFMKATLPTVVAVNSLRNIIKYGTDGRRV